MIETTADPGAVARCLVRRLLLHRDLAGAADASLGPAGPPADLWMLDELCALGRGSATRRRPRHRQQGWRTLLAEAGDPELPGRR